VSAPSPAADPNDAGPPADPNEAGPPADPNDAGPPADPNDAGPPASDPWKSFRGVMAATLVLEIISVLLAIPVVAKVGGGLTPWSTAYVLGFAALLLVLAGMQGRPWAIWANLGVQVILVAGFVVYPGIGFIGVLFTLVWVIIAWMRNEVLRRQRLGLLPGQQQPGP
jgi:hypothetical protein